MTLIDNQLEINVLLNDLKNVVKTRLLGINDCIRILRKNKYPNNKHKTDLILYKEARKQTNIILNKITILLNKVSFTVEEFKELKTSFLNMNIPGQKKVLPDDTFEN